MRISSSSNTDIISSQAKSISSNTETVKPVTQGRVTNESVKATPVNSVQQIDNSDETKVKVQEAVKKMNEMLDVNNSTSRFMYHDGLERYYVTVVDQKTEEIVKEIPPKKLLDAFYEMQKMLGMIVDEKI